MRFVHLTQGADPSYSGVVFCRLPSATIISGGLFRQSASPPGRKSSDVFPSELDIAASIQLCVRRPVLKSLTVAAAFRQIGGRLCRCTLRTCSGNCTSSPRRCRRLGERLQPVSSDHSAPAIVAKSRAVFARYARATGLHRERSRGRSLCVREPCAFTFLRLTSVRSITSTHCEALSHRNTHDGYRIIHSSHIIYFSIFCLNGSCTLFFLCIQPRHHLLFIVP